LLKQCRVPSSIGNKSTEIDTADCYITVPAVIELDPSMTSEPYINEGTSISYMTTNDMRKRSHDGDSTPVSYWTRSPNVLNETYVYAVKETGALYGYNVPTTKLSILIEISF
jgi:hypothetical protein